jgi:hypothetical protein
MDELRWGEALKVRLDCCNRSWAKFTVREELDTATELPRQRPGSGRDGRESSLERSRIAMLRRFPKLPEPMIDWQGTQEQPITQTSDDPETMLLELLSRSDLPLRIRRFLERRLEEVQKRRNPNPFNGE